MQVEWKVGTPSPFRDSPNVVWNVGEVKASDDELAFVETNITGLPQVNTAVNEVRYFGDFAKLIAGNLP